MSIIIQSNLVLIADPDAVADVILHCALPLLIYYIWAFLDPSEGKPRFCYTRLQK